MQINPLLINSNSSPKFRHEGPSYNIKKIARRKQFSNEGGYRLELEHE